MNNHVKTALRFSRRRLLTLAASLPLLGVGRRASAQTSEWQAILELAKGAMVRFNAWGGDQRINDYIAWAGGEIAARFGVELDHVKLADTADAVSRVIAERTAGQDSGGSVDLVWINGENFASLKSAGLLFGPFTSQLPNMRLVDAENRPTMRTDFSVPTEGLEAPWGRAQLVFFHDSGRLATPPHAMGQLRDWLAANPGRFTYPAPPDFLGTTFLKQALIETASDPTRLFREAGADAALQTESLWAFLSVLHPTLWRKGEAFPKTSAEMRNLVGDGETDLYFAFNPADASSAIEQGLLPDTMRPVGWNSGTIGNTHFLAIPYNASTPQAAMVAVDFLLSPEAQARKANADFWGDPSVLKIENLDEQARRLFEALPTGIATPRPEQLGEPLPEPHPSWVPIIEQEWKRRFAS